MVEKMIDFLSIDNLANKEKVAIVCIGYNRIHSLMCLFESLLSAKYPSNDIPLVISIDASNDKILEKYVEAFKWPYGKKYINIQKEKLGLKKHIFQCGDLSIYFKAIIILEDDSFVSPYFYSFTMKAVDNYGNDDSVCGISLYTSHNNEYVNIPFIPINIGNDVFMLQDVQTRGECFTYKMWKKFREWLNHNENRNFAEVPMPESIKRWTKAWSKYYYAYMIESDSAFIYPYVSFVTNMGAVGEHTTYVTNLVQVPLEWGKKDYFMPPTIQLTRYDAFYCNEEIYKHLNFSKQDLCLDLYGFNPNILRKRFILTYKKLPFKPVKSFGLKMYPIEINIIMKIPGNDLFVYDTTQPCKVLDKVPFTALSYIYCKHNYRLMMTYLVCYLTLAIKRKVKKKISFHD